MPQLYDKVVQLSITDLKKSNCIVPNHTTISTINWFKDNSIQASIEVLATMTINHESVQLTYQYKSTKKKYNIKLVFIASNLGFGDIWYFLCPATNLRCRKLYLIDGMFLNRKAFKSVFYSYQVESKSMRNFKKSFESSFLIEDSINELNKKYFKSSYSGKPTKKYLALQNRIINASNNSIDDRKNMREKRLNFLCDL